MIQAPSGRVVTFYSYKGGTGRSMALINVAWILASNGKRVLVLDWDLEAPGLHRYLAPFLADKDLTASDGIIDFVHKFMTAAATPASASETEAPGKERAWYLPYANILRYAKSIEWKFDRGGVLDFIPAGRQGPSYSTRVNSFNWQFFYDKLGGGTLLDIAKERMRAEYDYVLIDSRTGVSDTSGICTVQMPDSVVICFTLNNQSVEGAAAVAQSVVDQRSDVAVFPVPMRIENAEKAKLRVRQEIARQRLRAFPNSLSAEERDAYWEVVPVLYIPYYAYEEILACFGDNSSDRLSILAACEQLTSYLTGGEVRRLVPPPEEERQRILREYEGGDVDPKVELARFADVVLSRLDAGEQEQARRLFTRLVRVGRKDEIGRDALIQVAVAEIEPAAVHVLDPLVRAGLLVRETDPARGDLVRVADPELLESWPRLQQWIAADRDFLSWREQLREQVLSWREEDRDEELLLRGKRLDAADDWRGSRRDCLNELENLYIEKSLRKAGRLIESAATPTSKVKRFLLPAAMVLLIVITALSFISPSGRIQDTEILDDRRGTWSFSEDRSLVAWTPEEKGEKNYVWKLSEPWEHRTELSMPLVRLKVSARGKYVAGTAEDGRFYVWSAREGLASTAKPTLIPDTNNIEFGFSPDERWVYAILQNGDVFLWAAGSRVEDKSLSNIGRPPNFLMNFGEFSPRGNFFVLKGSDGNSIYRIGAAFGSRETAIFETSGSFGSLSLISPDDKWLAYEDQNRSVCIQDLGSFPLKHGEKLATSSRPLDAQFSPGGKWVAVSMRNEEVFVWQAGTLKRGKIKTIIGKTESTLSSPLIMRFDPSNRWLVVHRYNEGVYLWRLGQIPTGTLEPVIPPGRISGFGQFKFSPKGDWIAAGNPDIFVWKAGTRPDLSKPAERHGSGVDAIRWSADNLHLFTIGGGDISFGAAGERLETLPRQPSQVVEIVLNSDRKKILVFGRKHLSLVEKRMKLWKIPLWTYEWPELAREIQ